MEICHDVTFDKDVCLKKVRNLPSSKEDKEDEEAGKLEEPKDDLMPDVEGPMDPIDPPPSIREDPRGLGILSQMPRDMLPQGGHFVKAISRRDTKGI